MSQCWIVCFKEVLILVLIYDLNMCFVKKKKLDNVKLDCDIYIRRT